MMIHDDVHETSRLVGGICPAVPVFAVFYSPEDDQIFTQPVLFFTIWENQTKSKTEKYADFQPVSFSSDWLEEEGDYSNLLGLSLNPTPKREEWEHAVAMYKTRQEAMEAEARPHGSKGGGMAGRLRVCGSSPEGQSVGVGQARCLASDREKNRFRFS